MMKLYHLQSSRQKLLHKYDAIVTHSNHMLAELIKHGLSPQSAYNFPYYVQQRNGDHLSSVLNQLAGAPSAPGVDRTPGGYLTRGREVAHDEKRPPEHSTIPFRLVFSGRMEFLKGGHVFLNALPRVAASLGRPLHVVFAGEGRQRHAWEQQAVSLQSQHPELQIEFTGGVNGTQMNKLLDSCDLQVVPSLWPEPFGLVGPEAGLRGVPAAAFSVGGVPDWLLDGVNGYRAPGDPPTAEGLADAIIRCLRDPDIHAQLRKGAFKIAEQFSIKSHLSALMKVLEHVSARHPGTTIA